MRLRFQAKWGVIVLLISSSAATLAASRTIVGQWQIVGEKCSPTFGAISISPLGITGDEEACDFDSVKRDGSIVTWKGVCFSSGDAGTRTTVVAVEDFRGRLHMTYNGIPDVNGPYVRCDR
ncbi:hypothetical protein [Aurantimonas sp. DM33-3]|uniref:hypothetical protein n=1 Tax=Aurantimonas sp. DM33-3 TaxID=2766955 RepID=UPI0016529613|nr:hypothetical protein [Aurantimonas sp. DM33-3]